MGRRRTEGDGGGSGVGREGLFAKGRLKFNENYIVQRGFKDMEGFLKTTSRNRLKFSNVCRNLKQYTKPHSRPPETDGSKLSPKKPKPNFEIESRMRKVDQSSRLIKVPNPKNQSDRDTSFDKSLDSYNLFKTPSQSSGFQA